MRKVLSTWRPVICYAAVVAAVACLGASGMTAQSGATNGEWGVFGADAGATRYSPLDQIHSGNVEDLEVAWRWTSISNDVVRERQTIRPGQFKATPLMAGGLVYVSTPLSQVAALDAGTGELVWSYDPHTYDPVSYTHLTLPTILLV